MVLHQIGICASPPFRHDDMTALDQADIAAGMRAGDPADHVRDPGAGTVHQTAGAEAARLAGDLVAGLHRPGAVLAPGRDAGAAGQHLGAPFGGIERVQHHQAGVIDPAVRIFETLAVLVEQRRALGIAAQIQGAGAGQLPPAAEMVIKKQPEPDEPGRPILRRMRQHEAHRPDDVRRGPQKHLALDQRLAYQPELVIFQIAQAAMHQLARAGRCALRQIIPFAQHHAEASAGRIACDTRAVDAAADHEQVYHVLVLVHLSVSLRDARTSARASHAGGKACRAAEKAGNNRR
jgi:hypothetical protein